MDAVSGGVRSWMGWGVGCACAVWVTWGIDRVRLHTVSIPRRRQTLNEWLMPHPASLYMSHCRMQGEGMRVFFLGACIMLLEMCHRSIYTPCIQQAPWSVSLETPKILKRRGRMTIITNIYMQSYNRAKAGFCVVNLQSPSLKPS